MQQVHVPYREHGKKTPILYWHPSGGRLLLCNAPSSPNLRSDHMYPVRHDLPAAVSYLAMRAYLPIIVCRDAG